MVVSSLIVSSAAAFLGYELAPARNRWKAAAALFAISLAVLALVTVGFSQDLAFDVGA